jgi:hypothetical protein
MLVLAQVRLDLAQPLVCSVVRLDRVVEIPIQRFDLGEHLLRLGLLGGDRRVGLRRLRA